MTSEGNGFSPGVPGAMTIEEALAILPAPTKALKPLAPSYLDPEEWRPAGARVPPGWSHLRADALARDAGCVYCGHLPPAGSRAPLEVHHIRGHRVNDLAALESVCVLCHRVLHAGRSAAVYGSLALFRQAVVDQNTIIRLSWHLRLTRRIDDRALMTLLDLAEPAPFRMDRPYLATLRGYVPARYWLLERGGAG
ncbi:MAG TPA: HNH endonuclease signature motif containing protein [Chloroflexota bacterium]|nr:HNH endonuclease signature motif containing protein [Chloroflexota bacterium]